MTSHAAKHPAASLNEAHYGRLLLMAALSFICMYFLMYAMVNALPNVYLNLNQLYMAGLMTAPMVLIELILMRAMYHKQRLNLAIITGSIIVGAGCWALIRQQVQIGNAQFLRSMIPHHAGAILMCEKAPVSDPAIRDLCVRILTSQRAEIEEMKGELAALDGR